MKTKEKRGKFAFYVIFFLFFIILILFYKIYLKNVYVYADNIENSDIKISNAEKVNIEKIIDENLNNNTEQLITEEINVEYITEYKNNEDLPIGTIQVIQEGRTGKKQIVKKRTIDENGNINEEEISSTTIIGVVNKIVEVGTSTTKKAYDIIEGSKVYITSDRVDVKSDYSEQSRKITTLSKNTQLTVLQIKENWCKININGTTGWVNIQNVANIYSNPNLIKDYNKNDIKYSFDMSLDSPSGLSIEQFKMILTDSNDKNNIFSNNAEYFYYIEKQYNINGVFVAAIGIHESGWGTSKIAQNKKNLFGYRAYDSNPYSSASSFNSYAECIDFIARVLVKYYLNPRGTPIGNGENAIGTYYNGNTVTAVNEKYATDKDWAKKVYNYMEYLYKKI